MACGLHFDISAFALEIACDLFCENIPWECVTNTHTHTKGWEGENREEKRDEERKEEDGYRDCE